MRLIWIYVNEQAPAVSTLDNVAKIEDITIDGEPAIKATTTGGTEYSLKRSRAQPVIQWEQP